MANAICAIVGSNMLEFPTPRMLDVSGDIHTTAAVRIRAYIQMEAALGTFLRRTD